MLHEGRPAVSSGREGAQYKNTVSDPKGTAANSDARVTHSSVFGGHMGFGRMIGRITEHYWWRDMKASVKEYIRTCPACNERHREHAAPLAPEPRIAQPFARIQLAWITWRSRVHREETVQYWW